MLTPPERAVTATATETETEKPGGGGCRQGVALQSTAAVVPGGVMKGGGTIGERGGETVANGIEIAPRMAAAGVGAGTGTRTAQTATATATLEGDLTAAGETAVAIGTPGVMMAARSARGAPEVIRFRERGIGVGVRGGSGIGAARGRGRGGRMRLLRGEDRPSLAAVAGVGPVTVGAAAAAVRRLFVFLSLAE